MSILFHLKTCTFVRLRLFHNGNSKHLTVLNLSDVKQQAFYTIQNDYGILPKNLTEHLEQANFFLTSGSANGSLTDKVSKVVHLSSFNSVKNNNNNSSNTKTSNHRFSTTSSQTDSSLYGIFSLINSQTCLLNGASSKTNSSKYSSSSSSSSSSNEKPSCVLVNTADEKVIDSIRVSDAIAEADLSIYFFYYSRTQKCLNTQILNFYRKGLNTQVWAGAGGVLASIQNRSFGGCKMSPKILVRNDSSSSSFTSPTALSVTTSSSASSNSEKFFAKNQHILHKSKRVGVSSGKESFRRNLNKKELSGDELTSSEKRIGNKRNCFVSAAPLVNRSTAADTSGDIKTAKFIENCLKEDLIDNQLEDVLFMNNSYV